MSYDSFRGSIKKYDFQLQLIRLIFGRKLDLVGTLREFKSTFKNNHKKFLK